MPRRLPNPETETIDVVATSTSELTRDVVHAAVSDYLHATHRGPSLRDRPTAVLNLTVFVARPADHFTTRRVENRTQRQGWRNQTVPTGTYRDVTEVKRGRWHAPIPVGEHATAQLHGVQAVQWAAETSLGSCASKVTVRWSKTSEARFELSFAEGRSL